MVRVRKKWLAALLCRLWAGKSEERHEYKGHDWGEGRKRYGLQTACLIFLLLKVEKPYIIEKLPKVNVI